MASTHCPGLFCGRIRYADNTTSECGACPQGYRASDASICELCDNDVLFYDWLYLGFMALLLMLLQWYIIDTTLKRQVFTIEVLTLHVSAFLESAMASVLTVLMVDPWGSFSVRACRVLRSADWYPIFHNPSPGYKHTLRCANEAVYPLYSMGFLHLTLSLLFLLLMRGVILRRYLSDEGVKTIYLTMYLIPALTVIHAILAGLIYYSFPFIIILVSIVSIAYHLAFRLDQRMRLLLEHSVKNIRNLVILLVHWFLHAYGIIAITQLTNPPVHLALLTLVPLPTVFYILTSKFTDPNKLHED